MDRTLVPVTLVLVTGVPLPRLCAQQPQEPSSRQQALERATRELGETQPATQGQPPSAQLLATPSSLRLIDVSLSLVGAAGTSTERDAVLADLEGGGHDPKKRGFTLQQAELSLGGAVDPYFTAQAHLVYLIDPDAGESVVELEEAYLTSQALPLDLQLKAGMFLTEFGRINPTHAHAWDWQDQPVILTRLFGGDGMRAPGARLSWLAPTPNYTELFVAVQNANGEQMPSFLAADEVYDERPIGGRTFAPSDVRSFGDLVYSARVVTSWDLGEAASTALGASVALGPNATGDGAETVVWGADFVYKWRPPGGQRGWPHFVVQGEVVGRSFEAAAQVDDSDPANPVALPATTLHDLGAYLQATWGFRLGWDVGLRAEWAGGSGASYDVATQTFARAGDPYRADRFRIAPMLAWHPSEFSRFRLQYNYDDTDALADPVHSVWLGYEILIGKHPPHKY